MHARLRVSYGSLGQNAAARPPTPQGSGGGRGTPRRRALRGRAQRAQRGQGPCEDSRAPPRQAGRGKSGRRGRAGRGGRAGRPAPCVCRPAPSRAPRPRGRARPREAARGRHSSDPRCADWGQVGERKRGGTGERAGGPAGPPRARSRECGNTTWPGGAWPGRGSVGEKRHRLVRIRGQVLGRGEVGRRAPRAPPRESKEGRQRVKACAAPAWRADAGGSGARAAFANRRWCGQNAEQRGRGRPSRADAEGSRPRTGAQAL